MMGQASEETGVYPEAKGADFSGPLAVLGYFPPVFDQQDERIFIEVRTHCKPRANNSLFRDKKGVSKRGS
jgi:hypothetical protein